MFRVIFLLFLLCPYVNAQIGGFSLKSTVPYKYSHFKTITTEHFDIHYPAKSSEDFFIPQNMQKIAELSAKYFEEAFVKLTKDLNSTPYLRIQVVIVDNTDSHNGYATPIPQNTIYLFAVPPLAHSSISEYDNWLKDTAIHELTHIINLSTTRGYSVGLRAVFGTVVSMNGLSPLNLTEGYAVFEETNMTSRGRGRSTFLNTMLRTAAEDNKLNNDGIIELSKTPYMIDEWPMGNRPYLFGYLLFEHVALKYGLDVPGKISKHNAGVVPYYPSYSFENFTKKNISALWRDTLSEKNDFYKDWIAQIKKEKVTEIENKVSVGFVNRMPSESPDGKYLAYYSVDPDRRNAVVIIDAETGKEIHRRRTDDAAFVKWLNNDTIIFNRLEDEVSGTYYDVKTYNMHDLLVHTIGNSWRVLYLNRIDDQSLCVIRAKTGSATLTLENLNKGNLEPEKTLYTTDLLARIASPNCFRTDKGIKAYFIEKKTDKAEEIIELNEDGRTHSIYSSIGNIKDLAISNGKLLFIDDKDSVFNVYSSNMDGQNVAKLTNLVSGAFDIASSVDKQKAYITYYSSTGFKIGTVPLEEKHSNTPRPKLMTLPIRQEDGSSFELGDTKDKSYSPLKTLVPKLWVPFFSFVEKGYTAGGIIYGADALLEHQYYISGAYDSRTKKPLIGLSYTNQSFYPIISVSAYNDNTWFDNGDIIEDLNSNVNISIPLNTSWSIYTGIDYSYRKLDFLGERTKRLGTFWGVGYNETSTTLSSISSAESGSAGFFQYSLYPKGMGSTFNEYQIDGQISLFVPLWWDHNVLAINNNAAYSYGNPDRFFLVGGEGSSLVFGAKRFLVRGYPISYYATRTLFISNIEYRFPILTINDSLPMSVIFFKKISGALLMDNAFVGRNFRTDLHSFGGELRTSGNIFYHIPVTLRIGLYKAVDIPNAQLFFGISSVF